MTPSPRILALCALLAVTPGCLAGRPVTPATDAPGSAAAPASTRALPAVDAAALAPRKDPNQAAGAGTLLIYTSSTGHIPFERHTRTGVVYRGSSPQDLAAARVAEIEQEIASALARGEGREPEIPEAAVDRAPSRALELAPHARSAPYAPELEAPPDAGHDEAQLEIAPGRWGNARPLRVVRHRLDYDGDGTPEQTRYFDAGTGQLLRLERDRDGDGSADAWSSYDRGGLVERSSDRDGDGNADDWELYARGRMISRRIDRDGDGDIEAAYYYEDGALVEERHDSDGDGAIDRVAHYEDRVRVRAEEDRDRDGQTDTWTTYRLVDGQERVARIEHDRDGDGVVDEVSHPSGDAAPGAEPRMEDLSPL